MSMIEEHHMPSYPTVFALRYFWVHIGALDNSNVILYIETSVN